MGHQQSHSSRAQNDAVSGFCKGASGLRKCHTHQTGGQNQVSHCNSIKQQSKVGAYNASSIVANATICLIF